MKTNLLKQKVYPNNMKKNILDSIYGGGGGIGAGFILTGAQPVLESSRLPSLLKNW